MKMDFCGLFPAVDTMRIDKRGQWALFWVESWLVLLVGELSRAESMGACEINQKDLEKALAVTHPTMTEIIKRLEKKKAVICTQSKVDARYKKINCADEYKNIHIELKKMDWEIFNKICAGIPEEDIQTFLKASEKMLENIEK